MSHISIAPAAVQSGDQVRRWRAFAVLAVSYFMTIADLAIVNVALPTIGRKLHMPESSLQWVVTGYGLTFGGFLLLGGRAADLLGRRRILMVGLSLFTASSLGCGLATADSFLIPMRCLQGLGAAIVLPAALSIVMNMFREGAERNKALGAWGAIGASGATVGLIAGGLVYAISTGPQVGWGAARTVTLLAVSVALLAAFGLIETRAEAPLMPLRIFQLKTLAGANAVGLLLGGSFFAFIWATAVPVHGQFWTSLAGPFFVVGIGTAVAFIPVSIAALAGVAEHQGGLASGLINTSQQLGGAIGVAVASTIAGTRVTTLLHQGAAPAAALTGGFQWAFWACGAIGLSAVPVTYLLVRRNELARAVASTTMKKRKPARASAG